jgi:hypothetical protein
MLEVEIVASEITVRGRSPAFSDDVVRRGCLNVGYGSEAAAGKARREPPLSALVPMSAAGASPTFALKGSCRPNGEIGKRPGVDDAGPF